MPSFIEHMHETQSQSRTHFGDPPQAPSDNLQIGRNDRELPPLTPDAVKDPSRAHINVTEWFTDPDQPLEIEVGSGKGTFLVQQAPHQPSTNFLGIEYAGEFYRHALDRVTRRRIPNVRLLYADATAFLAVRCPSAIAQVIHLYFPDPWPKSRHHKRRTLADPFLATAHRILAPGGELRIATDHEGYWQWMEEHFTRWCDPAHTPHFSRHPFIAPSSADEGELVGTNFERKYRREGRTFNATTLKREDTTP